MFTGTVVDVIAIVAGSLTGVLFHARIPNRIKTIVFQGLGLSTLLIGAQMALKAQNLLVVIVSLLIGTIAGEAIQLEHCVERIGSYIKRTLQSKNETFTEGFVTASILICVGAMSILGSIADGLRHDHTILFTKAILDGFSAIALASTLGIGVMFSAIPILLYQGSISVFASYLQSFLSPPLMSELTAVGGLLVIGVALGLLDIKKMKVINMLPSIIVVTALAHFSG